LSLTQTNLDLLGVSKNDIQTLFEKAIAEVKPHKPNLIYLDVSYLYSFHLDDFPYIKKLNLLTRYDNSLAIEWHRLLERWCQDMTVRDDRHRILKPIKISRSLDRIVNEGMESVAGAICGDSTIASFPFRSIGDGAVSFASPSDKILTNEIDRIDVNETPEGGSLSRDGSTVYSIGNHSPDIPTPANEEFTECGMHSTDSETTDQMLDHSIFPDPVPHVQFADAPGSTTVIFMCSV